MQTIKLDRKRVLRYHNRDMNKRNRTILFLILASLFFLVTPSVILYSQGYRIDWEAKNLTQIGAFFFHITPSRTEIYIDEKPRAKTELFDSILLRDFPEKSYHVKIIKPNYYPWEKTLQIKPKQVTEAKNITLFSQDTAHILLFDNVQNFWAAPNNRDVIIQQENRDRKWQLSLFDSENGIEYPLMEQKLFKEFIADIQWTPDSSQILITINSGEAITYFVYDINRDTLSPQPVGKLDDLPRQQSLNFLKGSIAHVAFIPKHTDEILVALLRGSSPTLVRANIRGKTIMQTLAANVVTFATTEDIVIWLDGDGTLWSQNLNTEEPATIYSTQRFAIENETPYRIFVFGNRFFLRNGDSLFGVANVEKSSTPIFSSASEIILSSDSEKFAVSEASELWLYFLEEQTDQPKRVKNEKVFLTGFNKPVQNLQWLNNHYLIFSVDDEIKIAEIDDRDRINVVTLENFPKPKLFWNSQNKLLYTLSDKKFYVSEQLIP